MAVHTELGHGFLENVYQAALTREFRLRDILAEREVDIQVNYRGEPLEVSYRADFVCFGDIIVELKAIKAISAIEQAQVINYLKATGFKRALLINFGSLSLEYKRFVL